jgi:hypothetical protein
MQGLTRTPGALGLEMRAEIPRGDRDDEASPFRHQDGLGRIAIPASELDQAMANEGSFPDQHVREAWMLRVPPREGSASPPPDGKPDHAVGDTGLLGISPTGFARLEDRSGHVPLQQVDSASPRVGEVRELMDQQTLSRAGQPSEEGKPSVLRQGGQSFQERRTRI